MKIKAHSFLSIHFTKNTHPHQKSTLISIGSKQKQILIKKKQIFNNQKSFKDKPGSREPIQSKKTKESTTQTTTKGRVFLLFLPLFSSFLSSNSGKVGEFISKLESKKEKKNRNFWLKKKKASFFIPFVEKTWTQSKPLTVENGFDRWCLVRS